MSILYIKRLNKHFGVNHVLTDVDFSVESGKVYTIVGGNGSGKTTLLNIISGFIMPDSGSVLFNGKNIAGLPPYKINRLGIGRSFQDLRLAHNMTVKENVILASEKRMFEVFKKRNMAQIDEILDWMSLLDVADYPAGNISYGQQKLLTLACLAANNPNVFLIDEPAAGIDGNNMLKIIEVIKQLRTNGKTIIQIEHNDNYILQTSDCVIKIEGGKIIC